MFTRRSVLALVGLAIPVAARADTIVLHNGRYYRIPDPDRYPDDRDWLDNAPRRIVPRNLEPDEEQSTAPVYDPDRSSDPTDTPRPPIPAEDERQALASQSPIPRKVVRFEGYAPGTLVVSTARKRLYLVLADGATALCYGVGVGREGFSWKGTETISAKRKWPEWNPPAEMRARDPKVPVHMDGGLANPLGARALYLGETLYRIHGTNQPSSIGHSVSSGCVRLANADIIDLYDRVSVGATVVVL